MEVIKKLQNSLSFIRGFVVSTSQVFHSRLVTRVPQPKGDRDEG